MEAAFRNFRLDPNDQILLRLFNVTSIQFRYSDLDTSVAGLDSLILSRPAGARDLRDDETAALTEWAACKFHVISRRNAISVLTQH